MREALLSLYRKYRLYGLAGAVLWAVVAAVAWQYARIRGLPYLPTMVTFDEWVVAVLLLPRVATFLVVGMSRMTRGSRVNTAMQSVMYGGNAQAARDQFAEEFAQDVSVGPMGWASRMAGVAASTFALDLLVRGLFGLGWQPFV